MIEVTGAREHNLRNINVQIPRGRLTVITGLSGSGKSSLAFDTIYAEGQRRYMETFSAYQRGYLGPVRRPDVDRITGLSPVVSIEQKTTSRSPRSTVGTVTEVYDYLRLLFARSATPYSYLTGEPMVRFTEEKIVQLIRERYTGRALLLLAPKVRERKGHYRELFETLRKKGYATVRVDGELRELTRGMKTDRYRSHSIEVVIDKMRVSDADPDRLKKSVELALREGDGLMMTLDRDNGETRHYSRRLMCPTTGLAYRDPAPHNFSFNSPYGACPRCKGLGKIAEIDTQKLIPDPKKSIAEGAIVPLGKKKTTLLFHKIEAVLRRAGAELSTPVAELDDDTLSTILYGSNEPVRIPKEDIATGSDYFATFDGVIRALEDTFDDDDNSRLAAQWREHFTSEAVCPECHGTRLNREAMAYRVDGRTIDDLAQLDISQLHEWATEAAATWKPGDGRLQSQAAYNAAEPILRQIATRLKALLDIGLDYLTLARPTASLSGGESQRIRLATQIGSGLVGVIYILDEPSIGLHRRDNQRLIASLRRLQESGNTVIVVEHDRDMMLAADWIIDIGPRAGVHGGEVVFQGTPADLLKADTLTARYLNGTLQVTAAEPLPSAPTDADQPKRRRGAKAAAKAAAATDDGEAPVLTVCGATGHNLKDITARFPLGVLTVVTGVSGSGKSTLVIDTLLRAALRHFYRAKAEPLPYKEIKGMDLIDKAVSVDQSPIGRTPRSNPATYTGVMSDIRSLYVSLPEAKIRGYKAGRFSFNVKGGRCEACGGAGYRTIEMTLLPAVTVECEVCHGKRYNRETIEVRYKGKSIADVLDMTIDTAVDFFAAQPAILRPLKALQDIGLGYITLGQPSTTLSGGESQRVKLATELARRDTGRTLYILDEPTTGLHFDDIRVLLSGLRRLTARGNTVIVVEHNEDIIAAADHILELGPEGGRRGGQIIKG